MRLAKDEIINSINYNTKTYLKPSIVCNGVGVFALIDINKGEEIFPDIEPDSLLIEWSNFNNDTIKEYLSKLCNTNEQGVFLSRRPNEINVSYYINHSDKPNVYHDLQQDKYFCLNDIKANEELVCEYNVFEKDFD